MQAVFETNQLSPFCNEKYLKKNLQVEYFVVFFVFGIQKFDDGVHAVSIDCFGCIRRVTHRYDPVSNIWTLNNRTCVSSATIKMTTSNLQVRSRSNPSCWNLRRFWLTKRRHGPSNIFFAALGNWKGNSRTDQTKSIIWENSTQIKIVQSKMREKNNLFQKKIKTINAPMPPWKTGRN